MISSARVKHIVRLVRRGARFALRPSQRSVWFAVARVTDVVPAALVRAGIAGVLVDADATLVAHHQRDFSPAVRAWLVELQAAGLRVAIYSNADDQATLVAAGVPVIEPVPRKPAVAGFRDAVRQLGLRADQVVMIGDNLITDGAAIDAGLRFVYCAPLSGSEKRGHRWVRRAAHALAFGRAAPDVPTP
ncbi:MAG: HAD superfamily phosphatase (TIGR01668 family) [Bradymonadia bacterium]